MTVDNWLNQFEDEDSDGVPDWVEAAALIGVAVGLNVIGLGLVALAAGCA